MNTKGLTAMTRPPCTVCGQPVKRKRTNSGQLEKLANYCKRRTCGRKECKREARLGSLGMRLPARDHPTPALLAHEIAGTPDERAECERVTLAILNSAPKPLTAAGITRAARAAGARLGFEDALGAAERLARTRVIGCRTPEGPDRSGVYHPNLPKRKSDRE